MNYFFLPRVPPLESRLTLVNFSPEGRPAAGELPLRIYAAVPDGGRWRIVSRGEIAPGGTRVLSSKDAGPEASFFFLYPEPLPETLEELPVSPLMNAVPAWRGNIQLRSAATAVSYQGEYPDTMLPIPKGSLVSLCPLVRTGPGLATKLLLVNLQRRPSREQKTLLLASAKDRKVVAEFKVFTNACNVVDLGGFSSSPEDPLCVFSREITGVPLYLTHDVDFRHLSLEHSHPPAELTVFGDEDDRRVVISKMKKWWLEHVL